MNDSFLEDLELLPAEPQKTVSHQIHKHISNKNVTTRDGMPLPLSHLVDNNIKQNRKSKTPPSNSKRSDIKLRDPKKQTEPERDVKKYDGKETSKHKLDKREKLTDMKLKVSENKLKTEIKVEENRDNIKAKMESRSKVMENKTSKDNTHRSSNYKGINHSVDPSTKENSHPSDSAIDNTYSIQSFKEKKRYSEGSNKNVESRDKDPVALLNAIKDLISTYTKQESTKILRVMQELHINSQANLIKNLLCQTDELINEMHPNRSSARFISLLAENERLREDVAILQIQNSDLQKKVEELEFLKQENASLKLKCKELPNF